MNAGLVVGAFFAGIAVILVLIMLHEFGHFIIAKIAGAYVYEFAIGYGPRIYTHKGKETWFSIRLFPLGGFCTIASDRSEAPKGREEEAETIPDDRKMDYIARWKKAMFIIAGPVMNFAIAIIMISIIFMACMKQPQDMSFYGNMLNKDQIAYKMVDEQLGKENHDLQVKFEKDSQYFSITGWEVVRVSNNHTTDEWKSETSTQLWEQSEPSNKSDSGVKLIYSNLMGNGSLKGNISYENYMLGKDKTPAAFPKFKWLVDGNHAAGYKTIVYNFLDNYNNDNMVEKDSKSYIRFSFREMDKNLYTGNYANTTDYQTSFSNDGEFVLNKKDTTKVGINPPSRYFKNTTSAYRYSWKVMGNDSLSILKAFALLFTGHINSLAGPVGVASQTSTMITQPETFFLYVASLSANLFVLNCIPIPPLDGYRFCENAVEAAMKREVSQKTKYWLYGIGVAIFIIIFVVVTIKDFVIG